MHCFKKPVNMLIELKHQSIIRTNPFKDSIAIEQGLAGQAPDDVSGSVPTSGSLAMHVSGYDTYGNYRGSETADWDTLDGLAPNATPPTGSATYTFRPDPTKLGADGYIVASVGTEFDTTGLITISGDPVTFRILTSNVGVVGTQITDTLITTENIEVRADDSYYSFSDVPTEFHELLVHTKPRRGLDKKNTKNSFVE